MQVASGGESSLVIERWMNTYLVSADHPAPGELKARLDRIAAEELTAVCSRWLGFAMDEADPSLWLIREIELDLVFEANRDIEPGALARAWGERVAVQIARVIAAGEQGDSVLRFPNRAAYLAKFARDLAAGQAWEKWYYREFDSLRSLPAGAAICEALVREPGKSSDVLALLAGEERLEDVLTALSDLDATRIYRSLGSPGNGPASADQERFWTVRLLQAWSGIALGPANAAAINPRDQLRLYANAKLQFAAEETNSFTAAIDGLLELRRIFAGLGSTTSAQEFLHAAANGERERAVRILDRTGLRTNDDELDFIAGVSGGEPGWVERAGVAFGTKISDRPRENSSAPGHESFLTPFGGIFLLGRSFIDLRVEDAVQAAARACTEPKRAEPLIRHVLAAKCMGRPRASEAIEDAGLKTFAGVEFTLSLAEITSVLAEADAEQALRSLALTLAEQQRISPECLEAEVVPLPFAGGHAILLRDADSDEWIHATVLDERVRTPEAGLKHSLKFASDVLGERLRTLLLGPALARLRDSAVCRQYARSVVTLNSGVEADVSHAGLKVRPRLRVGRGADHALEYFALSYCLPGLALSAAQDTMWSLVARAVLKDFARRLIGFEASSPDHLFTNFLAGMSSVHVTPHRLEVLLPSSPLAVVLRLSGLYAQPCALPWRERREICLRAPAE